MSKTICHFHFIWRESFVLSSRRFEANWWRAMIAYQDQSNSPYPVVDGLRVLSNVPDFDRPMPVAASSQADATGTNRTEQVGWTHRVYMRTRFHMSLRENHMIVWNTNYSMITLRGYSVNHVKIDRFNATGKNI